MASRSSWVLVVLVVLGSCTNTFIDLSPDGEGSDSDVVDDDGGGTVVRPPPPCGNGEVDPGEECDDGNRMNGDGCTTSCLLGDGDPPGDPDPAVRPYAVEGAAVLLSTVNHPPAQGDPDVAFPISVASSGLVASWFRNESASGALPTLTTRFLSTVGTLVRPDETISQPAGWRIRALSTATAGNTALLAWRAGSDGIWRAGLTVDGGLTAVPSLVVVSGNADLPALTASSGGYMLAWYEGNDSYRCRRDGTVPSRIYLERLDADGAPVGVPGPVLLEDPDGARTSPRLVASSTDSSVGLIWWRAPRDGSEGCTLRFGVADELLTTVVDGGAIGPGLSGRITFTEGAYQVAWRTLADDGAVQIGVTSFDSSAILAAAPVFHEMPFTATWGDVALAAGDHGLVITIAGPDAFGRPRLYYFRTDLLGRAVGAPTVVREVDPSCNGADLCEPGPANVVWTGDAFVVVYFVTLDPGGPMPTTEMRMVRLVPET